MHTSAQYLLNTRKAMDCKSETESPPPFNCLFVCVFEKKKKLFAKISITTYSIEFISSPQYSTWSDLVIRIGCISMSFDLLGAYPSTPTPFRPMAVRALRISSKRCQIGCSFQLGIHSNWCVAFRLRPLPSRFDLPKRSRSRDRT